MTSEPAPVLPQGRRRRRSPVLVAMAIGLGSGLLLAAPLSGGLSLAPAAPVALAQAALAVHTTRLTGRLAAAELLRGAERGRLRPASLLRRLARQDPQVRAWLQQWHSGPAAAAGRPALHALLP